LELLAHFWELDCRRHSFKGKFFEGKIGYNLEEQIRLKIDTTYAKKLLLS
jgi:hypothetical protein